MRESRDKSRRQKYREKRDMGLWEKEGGREEAWGGVRDKRMRES